MTCTVGRRGRGPPGHYALYDAQSLGRVLQEGGPPPSAATTSTSTSREPIRATWRPLLAIGGSEGGLTGGSRKVSRFPPVVYYFPAFQVGAGETAVKTFHVGAPTWAPYVSWSWPAGSPQAAGTGAAASGAAATGAAFGVSELSVPVRSKLMAQLTAPRLISPGEEASIPATVFSFLGKSRGQAPPSPSSGDASIVGPSELFLDFEADGDSTTAFRIKGGRKAGGREALAFPPSRRGRGGPEHRPRGQGLGQPGDLCPEQRPRGR